MRVEEGRLIILSVVVDGITFLPLKIWILIHGQFNGPDFKPNGPGPSNITGLWIQISTSIFTRTFKIIINYISEYIFNYLNILLCTINMNF